jgi:hypothetical protein
MLGTWFELRLLRSATGTVVANAFGAEPPAAGRWATPMRSPASPRWRPPGVITAGAFLATSARERMGRDRP